MKFDSWFKDADGSGLTLTWDVLKYTPLGLNATWNAININMRCIEICDTGDLILFDEWLTLTWDVLKLHIVYGMQ